MSTQTKSAAEQKAEVDSLQRDLNEHLERKYSLVSAARQPDGSYVVPDASAEQIRTLEALLATKRSVLDQAQMEWMRLSAEEELHANKARLTAPQLFAVGVDGQQSGGPGSGYGPYHGFGGNGVARVADSLGGGIVGSNGYKAWRHGAPNQFAEYQMPGNPLE